MKKQLLASTALAAAGALAIAGPAFAQKMNKPTLKLSGWDEQIIGFANNKYPDNYTSHGNGVDAQTDSEIHFDADTVLDNGIRIHARVELEGNTSTDQIDENWMRVSGSFGQIVVGSTDGAAKKMVTGYQGSWSAGVGQNLALDVADWIEVPSGHVAGTDNEVTNDTDSEKMSYFTPRFEGFQLGASYIPGGSQDINNTPATRSGADHGGFQVGADFDRKFGELGLGLAAGYSQMHDALNADSALNKSWGGGIRLDFSGFRVGLGYVGRRDAADSTGGTTEGSSWDAGLRYTFGPNAVSLTGETVRRETSVSGPKDKTKLAMLSFRRTLGPGVNWTLNGMWAKYDGATAGTSDDNKGYAVTSSIKLNF